MRDKQITIDTKKISGYVAMWDRPMSDGHYYTPETDFDFDGLEKRTIYYKTIDGARIPVGSVGHMERDDKGIWVEGEINIVSAYGLEVVRRAAAGELQFSAGSYVPRIRLDGKEIKAWPIYELLLQGIQA